MSGEDLLLGTGRTGGRDATTGVIMGRYAISVGCPDTEPPHGWTWTALSSIAQLESGHTPSRKHPEYWDGVIPWIGIKDATENHGRTISDTKQHVSELGLENSSARLLPANTVCLSRTASVGFVVVMGRPMATSQDFVNWVCSPSIEPHFLKYVLLAENEALWRFASGTTHQTIYYPEAKAFHVCLPPLPEQRRIAKILGDLDDKIELNRKMNETLEQMARALFRSWFVDFDPVRAKMEGRTPTGMDAATAALFPDRLVDSELGMIPEGWEVKALGEVVDVVDCLHAKKPDRVEDGKLFLQLNNIRQDGLLDLSDCYMISDVDYAKWISRMEAQAGDCVITNVGRVGAVAQIPESTRCALGRNMTGIRCKAHFDFPAFLVTCMLSDWMKEEIGRKVDTGTILDALNVKSIPKLRLIVPSADLLAVSEPILSSIRKSMEYQTHQSRTLSTLRDTLLPKLVGGEVRV